MFVDDRVKAKIRFLRKADFHILHEFVDRDQLPESLGGKSKEKLLSDKQGKSIQIYLLVWLDSVAPCLRCLIFKCRLQLCPMSLDTWLSYSCATLPFNL